MQPQNEVRDESQVVGRSFASVAKMSRHSFSSSKERCLRIKPYSAISLAKPLDKYPLEHRQHWPHSRLIRQKSEIVVNYFIHEPLLVGVLVEAGGKIKSLICSQVS